MAKGKQDAPHGGSAALKIALSAAKRRGKSGQAREAAEVEAQAEMKKNRFMHWSIHGCVYGTKTDMHVAEMTNELKGKEKTRQQYDGPGIIWATRDKKGNIKYQDWPAPCEGPVQISTMKKTDVDSHAQEDCEAKLTTLDNNAAAFTLAEMQGKISRHEAQLIVDYESCYKTGVEFLKHLGYIELDPDEEIEWPVDEQAAGKAIFKELQDAYSIAAFPCMETVCIAARFMENGMRNLTPPGDPDHWVLSKPEYLDILLLLLHDAMWNTKGRAKKRKTLHNLPLAGVRLYNLVELDQDHFESSITDGGLGHNIVRDMDRLELLSEASPIAQAVVGARRRTPKKLSKADKPRSSNPMLRPAARFSSTSGSHKEWEEIIYDNSTMRRPIPTTIGPLAIMQYSEDCPEAAKRLDWLSGQLAACSHLHLVQMVWRDILIPAADRDDREKIDWAGGHLLLYVDHADPRQYTMEELKEKGKVYEGEDEEDESESSVENGWPQDGDELDD